MINSKKLVSIIPASLVAQMTFAQVPLETKIAECVSLKDQRGSALSIKSTPRLEIVKLTPANGKSTEYIKGESLVHGEFYEELLMEGTTWAGITHMSSKTFSVAHKGDTYTVTVKNNPNISTTCK